MSDQEIYDFKYYKKCADYIKSVTGDFVPELGLILGTGLNNYADRIKNPVEVFYKDIPGFLVSTAPGHQGRMIFGTVEGRNVVCMAGRFHAYEGYSFEQLSLPVRVLSLLGVKALIVTNAAGAINKSYRPGDIMIIKDHIKLFGLSPMRGPNIEEFGERFFDVQNMYDKDFGRIALECAKNTKLNVHEGVYFYFPGPQYETPAEIKAARILGGDAAGMSTVTETLTAAHCGVPVLGLSLMTNMAAGVLEKPLSQEDVESTAKEVGPLFEQYLTEIIRKLPECGE